MTDLNISDPQPVVGDTELPDMPPRPDTQASTTSEPEVTYADIAAAAVTALETIVKMLPDHVAEEVLQAFEARAEAYRAGIVPA